MYFGFMFSLGLVLGIVLVLGVGLGFGLVFSVYLGLGLGVGLGLGFGLGLVPDLIRYFIGTTLPYKVINPILLYHLSSHYESNSDVLCLRTLQLEC